MVRAADIPGTPADRAIWTLSAMILDALRHAIDVLDYLTILVAMALATLAVCLMNPTVIRRKIKIRKGQTGKASHEVGSATSSTSVEMSTTDAHMRIVKRDQLRNNRLEAEAEAERRQELGLDERKGGVEQEGLP
ncbi:hypothetical protein FRC09_006641 [Ceratobasidium sp. 395]|nr:hypothetical protein FRC09_006641 [Ceratobasidium sp. 395]